MYKKILLMTFCLFNTVSAYAEYPITTEEDRAYYCPTLESMKFKAFYAGDNIPGRIRGIAKIGRGTTFEDISPVPAPAPKNLDNIGHIQDIAYRMENGEYGYVYGHDEDSIICFYSYQDCSGNAVNLEMYGSPI